MGRIISVQPLRQGAPAQHASDPPVNQGVLVAGEQPDDAGGEAQDKRFIAVEAISFSQIALIYKRGSTNRQLAAAEAQQSVFQAGSARARVRDAQAF